MPRWIYKLNAYWLAILWIVLTLVWALIVLAACLVLLKKDW